MTRDIHSSAIVDKAAYIGDAVRIGPFCVIGPDVYLSDGVHLHNGVTVTGRTQIGSNCEIFPGAVIGAQAQILDSEDTPECRVEIGERTVIREQVTIHAGSPALGGVTHIGDDCFLMVGVHIAHDCYVSDKCVFANQVTLGGSVHVEEQVWIGGLAAVKQFCRIGRHAFAAGGAMIGRSVIPYGNVLGNRANLIGLNLVGLRRRGFSRQSIHDLRAAYRMLFAKEGKFAERIADTHAAYAHCKEVKHILDFIKTYEALELTMPE
jgi:UDP-N-acetylglucosamine acyltransferase